MSVIARIPKWILIVVALGIAVLVGALIYLRYFYGNDAPPPFELSPAALLVVRPRRRRGPTADHLVPKHLAGRIGTLAIVIAASSTFGLSAAGAATKVVAVKVGAKCTKAGASATAGKTAVVCTKAGKTLVWKAGAAPAAGSSAASGSTPAAGVTTVAAADTKTTPAASGGVEGTYKSTDGSVAGYRVRELFVGGLAKVDAVGRSEAVTASVTLARTGGSLVARGLTATVDMTQIKSDESRRDTRMRTTGLETDKFGTSTFTGSGDIALPADAEKGQAVKVTIAGKLTLHGVSKDVEIAADARLADGTLEVVGRLPIKMPDFAIEPPEIPDFVKADDDGVLEFKLVMKKA